VGWVGQMEELDAWMGCRNMTYNQLPAEFWLGRLCNMLQLCFLVDVYMSLRSALAVDCCWLRVL
jgi:hypothetical protein